MPIELPCRGCGQYYTPSKGDVLSGAYRSCPNCRKPPAPSNLSVEAAMVRPADRRALFETSVVTTALPVPPEIAR